MPPSGCACENCINWLIKDIEGIEEVGQLMEHAIHNVKQSQSAIMGHLRLAKARLPVNLSSRDAAESRQKLCAVDMQRIKNDLERLQEMHETIMGAVAELHDGVVSHR